MTRSRFARGTLVAALLAAANLAAPAGAAEPAPKSPPADPLYTHTVAPGDTVIGLSQRLLADPARWREVSRLNALPNPNLIFPGERLRFPIRLLRGVPEPASVLSVTGQVQAAAGAAQPGQSVDEGGEVATGSDGHVTLRLVDGTLLRLRPDSRLQLRESRRVPETDVVRSRARLERGRVEVEAGHAPAGRPGFRIETPQGVLGVRGTEFRVSAGSATRGEVLGGVVGFQGSAGGAALPVPADFGTVIAANGRVDKPTPLLGPVDTQALPALEENILLRFVLPPVAGAKAYRGQLARDAAFDQVVGDLSTDTPELRFAGMPDGDYVLRVRAIDGQGLEGRDADHAFRMKARPEAPVASRPVPRERLYGGHAEFAWAANPDAQSYRLQLAGEPAFNPPLRELADLRAVETAIDGLAPGTYYWRVASVRGDADKGPWGPALGFEMRPLPPVPPAPLIDDRTTRFAWDGQPGQQFDFEVARDPAFGDKVIERRLAEPRIELELPGAGRYYFRLRAYDADGFVGPYTTPQFFDIANCLRDGSGQCIRGGERTIDLAP